MHTTTWVRVLVGLVSPTYSDGYTSIPSCAMPTTWKIRQSLMNPTTVIAVFVAFAVV